MLGPEKRYRVNRCSVERPGQEQQAGFDGAIGQLQATPHRPLYML